MTHPIHNGSLSFSPPTLNSLEDPTGQARKQLTGIHPPSNRSKVGPEVVKAAEGMEAMFVDYMLKVMRESVPKNEMDLESPATGIYRGMLDTEYAQSAVRHGGIGLADQIIDYLATRGYHLPQGPNAPPKEKP
jgi:Rod binding domain-containing protein